MKWAFSVLICFCTICQLFANQESSKEEISLLNFNLEIPPPTSFTTPVPKFEELKTKIPQSRKNVVLATILSGIFPGLGHVYLGDIQAASGISGTFISTLGGGGLAYSYTSVNKEQLQAVFATASNTYYYGIYAAYRDARKHNHDHGYKYPMPNDSIGSLLSAPFSWSIIKKPEVWGGYLSALSIATVVGYFAFSDIQIPPMNAKSFSTLPLAALPVGIGEESLFRGYLQPALSEYMTPWGGIAASSILFGAAHIPNAFGASKDLQRRYYTYVIPFLTSMGMYMGWLTHKNTSLRESVALHTWYDFTLFLASSLATRATIGGKTQLCISFPF